MIRIHYFSKTFATASGWEPIENEIREQLILGNNNPTSYQCSILCDSRDNMVKWERSMLV